MSSREQQFQDSEDGAFAVFKQYKDALADVLVFSLPSLATQAAANGLIANAAEASVNRVGQATTQKERGIYLIQIVMSLMDKNMKGAADVMQRFLESIDQHILLHEFLSKR